jgi:hypothetical protein
MATVIQPAPIVNHRERSVSIFRNDHRSRRQERQIIWWQPVHRGISTGRQEGPASRNAGETDRGDIIGIISSKGVRITPEKFKKSNASIVTHSGLNFLIQKSYE